MRRKEVERQLTLPLGARFVDALLEHPDDDVRNLATTLEAQTIFDSVQYVMSEPALPAFLHSALCAMSFPVRRPKDEFAPIIRRDGAYSLVIRPIDRMQMVDGELVPRKIGVPFGVHARLVLLFIMTEAVKTRSREIFLGKSFSDWLRRMGITNTSSGGARGTRNLVQDQIDRLMSCEWTMRWDAEIATVADEGRPKGRGRARSTSGTKTISAFAVNDMRLVNQYAGVSSADGEFVSRFVLSEAFYENLIRHAVPLNERAFVALRKSATQIDLYTYLAYRLPRIRPGDEVRLKWEDLSQHLGNQTSAVFKFRQTVRRSWEEVSGVYQQARHAVDFDDLLIRLRHAEPPTDGHMLSISSGHGVMSGMEVIEQRHSQSVSPRTISVTQAVTLPSPANQDAAVQEWRFPASDHLQFAPGGKQFHEIAIRHGSNNAVEIIAAAFRRKVGDELAGLSGERLIRRWTAFCSSFRPPR